MITQTASLKRGPLIAMLAMVSIAILFFYLPSQYPAEKFYEQLQREHANNTRYWGEAQAEAILRRALDLDAQLVRTPQTVAPAVVVPPPAAVPQARTLQRLAQMRDQFLNSSYVQGMRATLLLAEYRLAALVQWGPAMLIFIALAVIDGGVVRIVRSFEFGDHSPVSLGVLGFALATFLWLVAASFLLPASVHPLFYGVVPLVVGPLLGGCVANLHRSALAAH